MSDMSAEPSEESVPELVTFQCRECYVYVPLPPGTSYGHRAELWNVDKWFKVWCYLLIVRHAPAVILHSQVQYNLVHRQLQHKGVA